VKEVLFLFHCGKTYPRLERWVSAAHPTFDQWVGKLSRYLQYRRNPRDQKYMERLAAEIYAEFKPDQMRVVGEDHQLPMLNWHKINEVVFLWPDGNGTGWSMIERQVFKQKLTSTRVWVVNGRRRFFELNRTNWRQFQAKRFLEKSFIPEFGIVSVFLITAPVLALWDLAWGRR
jgi:hypothetical protein